MNRVYLKAATFSPDEQYLLCGSDDGSVAVWQVKTGRLVSRANTNSERPVVHAAFNPKAPLDQIAVATDCGFYLMAHRNEAFPPFIRSSSSAVPLQSQHRDVNHTNQQMKLRQQSLEFDNCLFQSSELQHPDSDRSDKDNVEEWEDDGLPFRDVDRFAPESDRL